MICVPCPHCGPRHAAEFRWVGEARLRPDPNAVTAEEWHAYLYLQRNPAGWTTEAWYHRAGCRRYFVVERHTVTNEIRAPRPPATETREAVAAEAASASRRPR